MAAKYLLLAPVRHTPLSPVPGVVWRCVSWGALYWDLIRTEGISGLFLSRRNITHRKIPSARMVEAPAARIRFATISPYFPVSGS
jgi:hypothetical protein